MRLAALGLVCGVFLKGMVFFSGRGGGFPVHDIAIDAWVGTAGFAQLGVAAGMLQEGRGMLQGAGIVAG